MHGRYNGDLYGFASAAALQSFVASPEDALDGIRQLLQQLPLAAHLLGLTSNVMSQGKGCLIGQHDVSACMLAALQPTPARCVELEPL